MKIKNWGHEYEVKMEKTNYCNNGNLAIKLMCFNSREPYGSLTVNFDEKLPEDYAYVDVNNIPNAEAFIAENNLGEFAGKYMFSGFCAYPLYKFF